MTTVQKPREMSGLARFLIDLGPLVVFFVVNAFAPVPAATKIFVATGAFMVAMIGSMIASKILAGKVSPLLWFSGAMVVVLGGITIWLHNETFIKMKPTIYYAMVAALLAVGLATGRNLLKLVLGSAYPGLSERGWQLLTRNWILFFIAMAAVNELIWRTTSTDFWIGFKLWGALPAFFLFGLANIPMMLKHGLQLTDPKEEPKVPPVE
ncbi:septation protein A [Allosphingosinicella indica]|uniref:Inner membrane-spanning protein YciB n=1 Tax=Allosphingosinicella indica TaxID=941907 RepID=A0A1X7GXH1_9SPHN|nr:septation protein A [Allosphingosinicella indica]SMF75971.1 intracellular septation protein [Allosphingosinicella indica]